MKGSLTISRPSYGDGRRKIRICVRDELSRNQFLEVEIDYAEFTEALTGMSETEIDFQVYGLENVGKLRVFEKRQIVYPDTPYNKASMESWLIENAQEEGWIVNPYLGSQQSVIHVDGKTLLNYTVTKFVNPDEEAQ